MRAPQGLAPDEGFVGNDKKESSKTYTGDDRMTQHENTEHLAIRDTILRRSLTLLALRTTARFYQSRGVCRFISKDLVVKTGPFVHLTEAATMTFVRENTSIPVPRVHCAFVHNNQAYIVMERIHGLSIPKVWDKLGNTGQGNLLRQLRALFTELRAIPPPPGAGVQSIVGGSLTDSRIPHSKARFGPFKTIQKFHAWLRQDFDPADHPDHEDTQDWQDLKTMKKMHDGPWPPPVLTHGDLNPSNILIRDGNVVGIIDWEFSGWYPHYWEYTTAWYGNRFAPWWLDALNIFLDHDPYELKMDLTRQKSWGDF